MTSPEMIYLNEHTEDIEQKYCGKHIAILNDSVIASGDSITEVYQIVEELGVEGVPLVLYVPRQGEEIMLV